MTKNVLLALLVALPTLTTAQTPAPTAKPPSIEAYAALPGARGARLSPNGRYLALFAPVRGRSAVAIWDLDGRDKPRALSTGEGEPQWLSWKSDQRLVVSLRVVTNRGTHSKTVDTRLVSLDTDGRNVVELVRADNADYQPQIQDRVISYLPDDPKHILLELPKIDRFSRTPPSVDTINERIRHPEVVSVDLHTGQTTTVVPQNGQINNWIASPSGQVRLGWSVTRDKAVELMARDNEQSPWRSALRVALNQGQVFRPLAYVEGQPGRLYVQSNHETGRDAIYEFELASGRYLRTVASDAHGDIEARTRHGRLLGYEDGDANIVYLDPAWAADAKAINQALPDSVNRIIDRSRDGNRLLVSVVKGNEPEDFWVLNRGAGAPELIPVTEAYPGIAPGQIAPGRWTSYVARDGLRIPALLTLPVGVKSGDAPKLPFVLLPHGGPSAHDERGFDHWVQFLASRGYGVLQPQFRGSTGYGQKFLTAGYQQWGLAMQDDVTDGTRWLADQKLADPKRIAIAGASYGGYAALMGVAKEPGLYRAAVAISAVTDLPLLVEEQWEYSFGDLNLPQIAGKDSRQLARTSPARLAEQIGEPVLLIHGRKDYTVPVRHTELMESAMKKAGKRAETIYLNDADHYFQRGDDRLAVLKALERFLAANL